MSSAPENSHQYNKGITQTFYTVLIALISMGLLILILVLFIQRFYNFQLNVEATEQDRAVINLAQALLSSDKLVYVDSDGVAHRAVIDADKASTVNMDDLRNKFSYTAFYYTLTIRDLAQKKDVTPSISVGESLALSGNYGISQQTRNYPVAIKYADGTIDAGVMSIETGFASATGPSRVGGPTGTIPAEGLG